MKSELNIPTNLQIADPEFYKPSDIHMLTGAELFFDLLCDGKGQVLRVSFYSSKHSTRLDYFRQGDNEI